MLPRAVELTQQALYLVLVLSGPALLAAAVVGLAVGLFASATQVHDPTLAYLPRLLAVTLVLVALGAWGAAVLVRFTHELWRAIPALVR